MAYDSPNQSVRREAVFNTVAGATTEGAKFRSFQAMKLKAVHAAVITAGTNAGHGYDIYRGTTSVGTMSLGTSGTNVTVDSATLNLTCTSMQQISVKSLVDATGVAQIVYEYEVLPEAAPTA